MGDEVTFVLKKVVKICLDIGDTLGRVHKHGIFKMQIETPVIEIYRADHSTFVIGKKILRMNETGNILIDLDAILEKFPVIRTGYALDVPFIWDMGCDYAHIDTRF